MKLKDAERNHNTQIYKNAEMEIEDPLETYLDGMGTATARIIISRHLDDHHWEKHGLKNLKNTGYYYIAKVVEKDGRVIDEVLVNKQSGTIRSLRGRTRAGNRT